jgi:hypothetical protein
MMNENVGFNEYSLMNKEDRGGVNSKVYKILKASYDARDQNKFGRLSFREYLKGLTPSERYETEYSRDNPSEAARLYGEVFGSDMELMKQAAIVEHENLPVTEGLYRQGE